MKRNDTKRGSNVPTGGSNVAFDSAKIERAL